ncbi:MAG: hypothetical protein LH645_12915 [Actinomycetia bacterium]|nr:hypothetical protein [Actinomycetes bacterium]
MNSTEFLAPDGSLVSLALPSDYIVDSWSSRAYVVAPLDGRAPDAERIRDYHITRLGNCDYILNTMYKTYVAQEVKMSGGTLTMHVNEHPSGQGFVVWRGLEHEVSSYMPPALARNAEFVFGYFSGLHFEEEAAGVLITSPETGVEVGFREATTYVRDVGLVDVRSPSEGLALVPSWQGAQVRAGEVWKASHEGEEVAPDQFILASDTAIMIVSPEMESGLEPTVRFLESIDRVSIQESGWIK